MEKKYWKSLNEAQPDQDNQAGLLPDEKPEPSMAEMLSGDLDKASSTRRDFLKWCGISFVSATVLSACENPVKKAIPYLNQPEVLIPGKASWYATTYLHGNEYCPILVKSRDGRPIKIEGNTLSSITKGGTSARVQASVLSLYDTGARYKSAMKSGQETDWATADLEIFEKIKSISESGGRIALVTPTLLSPATRALIDQAKAMVRGLEVITWDAISYSALRLAHAACFGNALIPGIRFENAELIVSFSSDFLGTWLSPIEFSKAYSKRRRVSEDKPEMSRHIQFESMLSLTGANADERHAVAFAEEIKILMALYDQIAAASGQPVLGAPDVGYDVKTLAGQLLDSRDKALVVSGHNITEVQMLVAGINFMIGAYESILDTSAPIMAGMSDEAAFVRLVDDMNQGKLAAVMFYKTNPVYHFPEREKIISGIEKTGLSISFAGTKDETAAVCQYILPDHHYLEAWGDAEFKAGHYSLVQPLIHPLFKTRQFQDTLLRLMGLETDFHTYLKEYWQKNRFQQQTLHSNAEMFWVKALQAGVFEAPANQPLTLSFNGGTIIGASAKIKEMAGAGSALSFVVYPALALADGHDANNPWLQELPDPITSVCWDNFAAVLPATGRELGLAEGDLIKINRKMEIPVLYQPGLAAGCMAIALGYGRTHAGISADNRGGNGFLLSYQHGQERLFAGAISSWEKIGKNHQFARTQTHFSMEGRAIVRESNLDKYRQDPAAGNELHKYHKKHQTTLYPETKYEGHHWALMVDLNACTGCSTCVIGCQSENNTPVIGKEEVRRRRIMHWMRIDRYYTGTVENPGVVFQPLMCQHCDHAPCENVCPVAATTHSQEGINQITYNRCVGTKYCINNCPYKVRRFNWFEYATKEKFNTHTTTNLGRMVLNPDVTVRERGVVEKCSFCVQRIQEAKLLAKNERRILKDGEILPACVQACPSDALVFGDLNDAESKVSILIKDPRNYHLLEELHTLPSVGYLTKIRNPRS